MNYSKDPGQLIQKLHSSGFTGKDIGIAIIDQRLNLEHEEYKKNICHYDEGKETFEEYFKALGIKNNMADYHASLVAGIAVGQTCGVAKDADLYFFASHNWIPFDRTRVTSEHNNKAIEKMILLNRSLSDNKKIRFLSCSWGYKDDLFFEERCNLFEQAEKEGIMVLGGFYDCWKRPEVRYRSIALDKIEDAKDLPENTFLIPTNHKINASYKGGFEETENGGSSSTFPYLAGVFTVALQSNPDFIKQDDWQNKLMRIALKTATKYDNGAKLINPLEILHSISLCKE